MLLRKIGRLTKTPLKNGELLFVVNVLGWPI
jgi:hypothetical protein